MIFLTATNDDKNVEEIIPILLLIYLFIFV
jgi:hypothetical protein